MWCLSREKVKTIKEHSRLVSEVGWLVFTFFFLLKIIPNKSPPKRLKVIWKAYKFTEIATSKMVKWIPFYVERIFIIHWGEYF